MKIIKYVTGAKATSYKMKYAVHDTFSNTEPTEEGLGENLKKVMDYYLIRAALTLSVINLKNWALRK